MYENDNDDTGGDDFSMDQSNHRFSKNKNKNTQLHIRKYNINEYDKLEILFI